MSYLVRTRSGQFKLENAYTLEELAAGRAPLMPPAAALGGMPQITVAGPALERLTHGVAPRVQTDLPEGTVVALMSPDGDLLALAEAAGDGVRLRKVFA